MVYRVTITCLQYAYDLNGNVILKTNPNGNASANTYDALNRLVKRVDGNNKLDLNYYYDLGGNVVQFNEYIGNITSPYLMTAGYDAHDRLVSEGIVNDRFCQIINYRYDAAGNRVYFYENRYSDSGGNLYNQVRNYSVNSLNQISTISENFQKIDTSYMPVGNAELKTTSFVYNTRGNMESITEGTTVHQFYYNEFDMLDAATKSVNGNQVSNNYSFYDYRGRRLKQSYTSDTEDYDLHYTYSGGTSVSQRKGMGNNFKETLFYRGSDMGGGVGGINYDFLEIIALSSMVF